MDKKKSTGIKTWPMDDRPREKLLKKGARALSNSELLAILLRTPSNIGFVRAEGYRNDLLVKHLRDFPGPPNLDRNEGVRAIRTEMDKYNLYPPVYITYPTIKDSVCCVLLNAERASE